MGIRTASARAETLGAGDVTLRGTYWYDLRARRPAAAALKRALDLWRFSVCPGITGLWRIEKGEERELDRRYVNEWSVARDLMILARTGWSRRPATPRR
ncbi:MAG: sugar transferase [Thermoanaerobaculia bacterium]